MHCTCCQRPSLLAPHHKRDKRYTNLFYPLGCSWPSQFLSYKLHHASASLPTSPDSPLLPFLFSSSPRPVHTPNLLTALALFLFTPSKWLLVLRTLASRPLRFTFLARYVLLLNSKLSVWLWPSCASRRHRHYTSVRPRHQNQHSQSSLLDFNFLELLLTSYHEIQYVEQTELEKFDGVSTGKYTIGLGQTKMAFCDDREGKKIFEFVSIISPQSSCHSCL